MFDNRFCNALKMGPAGRPRGLAGAVARTGAPCAIRPVKTFANLTVEVIVAPFAFLPWSRGLRLGLVVIPSPRGGNLVY